MDENCYLVLNSKQSYSITIDSLATVETFCLFFRNGLVEDVCRVTESGPTSLLDNPVPGASHALESAARADSSTPSLGTSVEFFETLHAHDAVVSPLIQRIYARLKDNTASDLWLEDQFLSVAGALCKLRREADKDAELIPAKKYSSRMELYRRLLRGKDYMDSFSRTSVHLGEVAENACLSPYHFHRLFREVFRETPNQYLQRKRLANARRLLERGEQSVTDVCLEVGFESVTSFSGLFRRQFAPAGEIVVLGGGRGGEGGDLFGIGLPGFLAAGAAHGPATGAEGGGIHRVGCRTMGTNDLHGTNRRNCAGRLTSVR